ncbi:MAG: hypothetical protein ACK49R_15110 [Planctomycetota bacterium]
MGRAFEAGVVVRAFLEEYDPTYRRELVESRGPFVVACFENLPKGYVPVVLKAIEHITIATPSFTACLLQAEQVHDVGAIAGARATLDYIRDQVDLPKEITMLIGVMDRLQDSILVRELPEQTARNEPSQAPEPQDEISPKMKREALAVTILTANPGLTNRKLAKMLECSEASVCRMESVKQFRKLHLSGHQIRPGVINRRRDGRVDCDGVDED